MGYKDWDYFEKYVKGRYDCKCSYCQSDFNYISIYNPPKDKLHLNDGEIQIVNENRTVWSIVRPGCLNHRHKGTGMNCRRCRGGAMYKK